MNRRIINFTTKEEWLPVIGYEEYYLVSNYGRVMALPKKHRYGHKKNKILKAGLSTSGHLLVVICVNAKPIGFHVHRLMCKAFLNKEIISPMCCNHINGIKTDNRLCNLEIVSKSEDLKHAYRLGLRGNKKCIR